MSRRRGPTQPTHHALGHRHTAHSEGPKTQVCHQDLDCRCARSFSTWADRMCPAGTARRSSAAEAIVDRLANRLMTSLLTLCFTLLTPLTSDPIGGRPDPWPSYRRR